MARLPTGTPATPPAIRQAGYRQELVKRGGRRLLVDLEPEAAGALAALEARGLTKKQAVTDALIAFANPKAARPTK